MDLSAEHELPRIQPNGLSQTVKPAVTFPEFTSGFGKRIEEHCHDAGA